MTLTSHNVDNLGATCLHYIMCALASFIHGYFKHLSVAVHFSR